jgi:uncharacterized membrane protein YGL010W
MSWEQSRSFHGLLRSLAMGYLRVSLINSKSFFVERSPALVDNLFLILVAPFFAVFEYLILFGYKASEVDEWEIDIIANIQEYRKQKGIKLL